MDQEVKFSQKRESSGYGHKQETIILLDYLFSLYKMIDQRQLSKRFSFQASMFLNEKDLKKLVD
jgi:hypothetical protein